MTRCRGQGGATPIVGLHAVLNAHYGLPAVFERGCYAVFLCMLGSLDRAERKASLEERMKTAYIVGNNQNTVDIGVIGFIEFISGSSVLGTRLIGGLNRCRKRV